MGQTANNSMDVVLNQWSLAIQVSILAVFVVVFLALWLNSSRRLILVWLVAWACNALALLSVYGVLLATDHMDTTGLVALYSLYAWAKLWFALLLVAGLRIYLRQNALMTRRAVLVLLAITLAGWLLMTGFRVDLLMIQVAVYWLVGLVMSVTALWLMLTSHHGRIRLLVVVVLLEGVVFLHHGWVLLPVLFGEPVPRYMTHISFFDSISEMVVGIACLFAIASQVIDEIRQSNRKLEQSQDALRELVDVDPLTHLWNRRKLKSHQTSSDGDAYLVYIDVDNFKQINDRWGHTMGDACLIRVADAMRQHFRDDDGIFRLGGDEFLLIVQGLNQEELMDRISAMQVTLADTGGDHPAVRISVGVQTHRAGEDFELSLSSADANMYQAKRSGRGRVVVQS